MVFAKACLLALGAAHLASALPTELPRQADTECTTWSIDSIQGALIRGTAPGLSASSSTLSDYTLTFQTKLVHGGSGWALAIPSSGSKATSGIYLNVVGSDASTTPASKHSLTISTSWDPNDAGSVLAVKALPIALYENAWFDVITTLSNANGKRLSVTLGDAEVLNTSLGELSGAISTEGSFGFAAAKGQEAYVRNVVVTDAKGEVVLVEDLTDRERTVKEFGVGC